MLSPFGNDCRLGELDLSVLFNVADQKCQIKKNGGSTSFVTVSTSKNLSSLALYELHGVAICRHTEVLIYYLEQKNFIWFYWDLRFKFLPPGPCFGRNKFFLDLCGN